MLTQKAKSQATVRSIMEAAQTLFTARPYAAVSMNDIARRAAVTKGALYHHFSGKESLYLRMLHHDLDEKRSLYAAAVAGPGDCRDRLRRLTLAHFGLPPTRRETIRLVRRDANSFSGAAREDLVRAYQTALPAPVESVLREGMARGEVEQGDARLLSWQFVALVETTMSLHGDRVLPDPGAKVEEVLGLFMLGAAVGREAA